MLPFKLILALSAFAVSTFANPIGDLINNTSGFNPAVSVSKRTVISKNSFQDLFGPVLAVTVEGLFLVEGALGDNLPGRKRRDILPGNGKAFNPIDAIGPLFAVPAEGVSMAGEKLNKIEAKKAALLGGAMGGGGGLGGFIGGGGIMGGFRPSTPAP